MSDNEYIDNFLKWFESEYPLAKGTNTKVFIFNISYKFLLTIYPIFVKYYTS